MKTHYDLIVIGAGAAGIMAAITAAEQNKKVLLLEKLSQIAAKLKATGGGRCNLTNTLGNEEFMTRFGRDGRFMRDALELLDHKGLQDFFRSIGVETHAPDGYRVFPTSHSSSTIIEALEKKMHALDITLLCKQRVQKLLSESDQITGVETQDASFFAPHVVIATGGLGYPTLGAEGDGYRLASDVGHSVSDLNPAMMPLRTKESWVAECRADTIAKVKLRVAIQKYKKLRANGDLIFTKSGIRGPVVLDFARDITPLLKKYSEVPILLNLTKGMNEDAILKHLKEQKQKDPSASILELVSTLLPTPLSKEICKLCEIDPSADFNKIEGVRKDCLIKTLAWTPLTITGHDGFKMAMITRGGVSLKEIDPKTMQSKIIKGLYFCGEVMNIDGPCGGYNLQWSFSSGALAGLLKGE
ncbi:MAG: NAD(P)/FAD-dependent oxidoreductase [Sulfurimonas sp.]|jgi:predicted Rossmann fold flavoprotein|nr:NAD(P)/FAD-dependent oxidoreductase [Sulfurimonas sp.]